MPDFAKKGAHEANAVGDKGIATLNSHGFSEEDIRGRSTIKPFSRMSNRLAPTSSLPSFGRVAVRSDHKDQDAQNQG
jgi:hypothetical protein